MSRRDDPDFLARWSRRKRDAAKDEDTDEAAARSPEGDGPVPAAAAEEKSDAEILEELGLPDPDTLGPGADFKGFMMKAVPERLRNRALRRLWLSDPALANLDELLEYGEDFASPSVVEAMQTAYQVGKGYLLGDDKEGDDTEGDEESGGTAAMDAAPEVLPEVETGAEADIAAADEEPPDAETGAPGQADGEGEVMPRRRMRFHIAES